eukprot:CAMPEP_0201283844 /NCGR_PEP_ID=MMETSP1317-20130820/51065_1 /ASSEMBLY_ACC=CAM_ASM_000770 /TAXON_ID=187299 /ORGANISM="Undescribed Undescribed, Strain Undescribed" /LENGTH=150 /DNA_ID=CAMNT_0047601603 /DNA_START=219 /DNA_END=668 /DNA_ORIENTATION=+
MVLVDLAGLLFLVMLLLEIEFLVVRLQLQVVGGYLVLYGLPLQVLLDGLRHPQYVDAGVAAAPSLQVLLELRLLGMGIASASAKLPQNLCGLNSSQVILRAGSLAQQAMDDVDAVLAEAWQCRGVCTQDHSDQLLERVRHEGRLAGGQFE